MADRLWIADAYHGLFHRHRLTTVDTFLRWTQGERVSARNDGLETIRVVLPDDPEPPVIGYVKRYARWRGEWSYLRHVRRLRREIAALSWLERRRIAVPALIAWGIRRRWGMITAAFLVTREVAGAEPLSRWIESGWPSMPTRKRRRAVRALAELVGAMHREGFFHGNLYFRNILIQPDRAGCVLIDFPACRIAPLLPRRDYFTIRDLSALVKERHHAMSPFIRGRFLKIYVRRRWPHCTSHSINKKTRRLWNGIARRLGHLHAQGRL